MMVLFGKVSSISYYTKELNATYIIKDDKIEKTKEYTSKKEEEDTDRYLQLNYLAF